MESSHTHRDPCHCSSQKTIKDRHFVRILDGAFNNVNGLKDWIVSVSGMLGDYPLPIRLGSPCTMWRAEDIDQLIDGLSNAS